MVEQIEKFTKEFFENLKSPITFEGNIWVVEKVPKSFEDIFGKLAPYRLTFDGDFEGAEFVGKGSQFFSAMMKYLENSGKTTLLKIDFEVDPLKEIEKVVSLKNCEIDNLVKRHKNNFISRFTFMTSFQYLNETEKVMNEVYVHEGKIVEGDLEGYEIIEGIGNEATPKNLEADYSLARDSLKDSLKDKTDEVGKILGEKLDGEVSRIKEHYDHLIGELGGDLSGRLKKIKEVELELRTSDGENVEVLRQRLERLQKGIVKMGDDDAKGRILKEQEFTIKGARHKYSLNINNNLINTTVIYYPVFLFNLFLKGKNSKRFIEMTYDPLIRKLNNLKCESCEVSVDEINLCSNGHITCENCFGGCGDCGNKFCEKCLKKSCSSCGKLMCKNCSKICFGCGKSVCEDHFRVDGVSGEKRCVRCLRACLRCHGLTNSKYFGEALDGSKVCQKCLGVEKRRGAMKRIFEE